MTRPFVDLTVEDILNRLDSYRQLKAAENATARQLPSNAESLKDISDLREYAHLNARFNLPPSHRSGLLKSVANLLLHKLYIAVRIFLSGVISAQERFNQLVLNQLLQVHGRLETLEAEVRPDLKRLETLVEGHREKVETLDTTLTSLTTRDDVPIDYVAFENRFRGGESLISEDQRKYLPYFSAAKKVLDIGCGRGEFIRLLQDARIKGVGIDIDADMVRHCRREHLDVHHTDALTFLKKQKKHSFDGIVAFQVAEHLHNRYLIELINECYRVLAPEGHMILETLNPQSLNIFVNQFYLDLTHEKPLHPKALEFLADQAGFRQVETKYFSLPPAGTMLDYMPPTDEAADTIMRSNIDKLNNVLFGYQDYAIIARK